MVTNIQKTFPEECVALYNRWWVLLDKIKATGRFDEERINKWNDNFSLMFIESFKNPPRERTPPREEYIQACVTRQQTLDILSRGIENIENKSDEELSKAVIVGGFLRQK